MPQDPNNMLWVDLEMTGLDPDACHIIEIASLVTNAELEILAEGPNLVIHASEEELETLSAWSAKFFGESGLLDRCKASTISCAEAEEQTLEFIREWLPKGAAPLCGNSVHNDRAFLRTRMPRLHDYCHYRNVDVSSWKHVLRHWYPDRYQPPAKAESHEALADVRESVEELRYYRRTFLVP